MVPLRAVLLSSLLVASLAANGAAQPAVSSLSGALSGVPVGELAREAREGGDAKRGAILFHQGAHAIEPPVHKWIRYVAHVEPQPDKDWPHLLLRQLELRQRERAAEPGAPELRR